MPNLVRYRVKKKLLNKLYLQRKFNLKEIGELVGFSARTIQILMHEYKIPLRPSGNVGPTIKFSDLKELYIKKGLSSRKIAKIYKCSYSYVDKKIRTYGLPVKTLAAAHITTKRNDFSGDLNEKAYLIGFKIGDLRARKLYKNSETIRVDCGSTKPEQIKLIKRLFRKYGRVWISKPKSNKKTQIECSLNRSFSFLLKTYEIFPKWIEKTKKLQLFAIAGFIDAEGSFYISDNRAGFTVGNYNKKILEQINTWLKNFCFKTRFYLGVRKGYTGKDGYSHKQDYWMLSISTKKNLMNFIQKILPYLRHKDRISCAERALKNIRQRNEKYGFVGM